MSVKPVLSFGLITDIQYADVDDAFRNDKMRYYRKSLSLVKQAVEKMAWRLKW